MACAADVKIARFALLDFVSTRGSKRIVLAIPFFLFPGVQPQRNQYACMRGACTDTKAAQLCSPHATPRITTITPLNQSPPRLVPIVRRPDFPLCHFETDAVETFARLCPLLHDDSRIQKNQHMLATNNHIH